MTLTPDSIRLKKLSSIYKRTQKQLAELKKYESDLIDAMVEEMRLLGLKDYVVGDMVIVDSAQARVEVVKCKNELES